LEKSSFFNSVNGDRKYKASDFAEYFNSLVTNGVFPDPSTNLQVMANNNMTITLKQGKAWINGYVYINTDDLILNIDVADGVLNRIDRVVLRMDTIERNITAKVKKGSFASTPVAPILQRDADAYELGIADIYVTKGAVSIVQANITDLRLNTDLCGVVNSLIQADTTAIFNQYLNWFNSKTGQYESDMSAKETDFTNQFNTWFATIQGTLSGDVAGNLLNLINENVDKIGILNGTGSIQEKANKTDFESHKADNVQQFNNINTALGNINDATLDISLKGKSLTEMAKVLFQNADNGQKSIANVVGSPTIIGDTYTKIANDIQTQKNNLATNLTNKGQSSVGTETLANLIAKVANVNTGLKYASGILNVPNLGTDIVISGFGFTPKFVAYLVGSRVGIYYPDLGWDMTTIDSSMTGVGSLKYCSYNSITLKLQTSSNNQNIKWFAAGN
jgi:hypothetical protein